ncbi:MAG: CoB--CoM heterodisulfide reductase iron-sulfur subunit A family protein [Desulfobacteraceae bacterium]|nr:CoB--CoM heterodisulfide reductase iron-sulfur subunit A family protein [Desulfobacteraceae bacterium]
MLDVGRHPNVELMAYSEVEKVEGNKGNFKVTVRKKARYVDENKCTGCGACTEKCPTSVPDAFNEGFSDRKAIYSWFAQGIPSTHAIDPDFCRVLNGKKCGVCQKKCEAGAIDFEQKDKIVELDIGSIIVATGYDIFNPEKIPEYRYKDLPNVITAIEFERFLSASGPTEGHIDRPSDIIVQNEIKVLEKKQTKSNKALTRLEDKHGQKSKEFFEKFNNNEYVDDEDNYKNMEKWADKYKAHLETSQSLATLKKVADKFDVAKKLAFIQCVGSRDLRFFPFCSGYCCMHSIKEAIIAHEHENETTSTIFGMDIRAVSKGFEEYKVRGGNNSNISYVRGRVAEITSGPNNNPVIIYEDTKEQKVKKEDFELVILATACAPDKGVKQLSQILDIEIDKFGFFKTNANKPLDTTREGIFVCGCAHSPMDIPESVAQASSAASRAVQAVTEVKTIKAS